MPNLGFIMAFVGASVALLIGIMIFTQVDDVINCNDPNFSEELKKECDQAKDTAWTVIGILPIALFFAIFAIFGSSMGGISMPKIPKLLRKLHGTSSQKLKISQKIMLFLGLAKVKKA